MIRKILGLGPSKSERIADLEARLELETATLDIMAFNHPRTYREARGLPADTMEFRPGVARMELRKAAQFKEGPHIGSHSGAL